MSKLILKNFSCIETTSGSGSDSPYFLIFVGGIQNPPNNRAVVKRVRLGPWHDEVDSGELWPVNHTVVNNFDLDVALCVMIEEDGDGPDIGGPITTVLENYMKGRFNLLTAGQTTVSQAAKTELRNNFKAKVNNLLGNDDYMGIHSIDLSQPESERHYTGDGANYKVRFQVQ